MAPLSMLVTCERLSPVRCGNSSSARSTATLQAPSCRSCGDTSWRCWPDQRCRASDARACSSGAGLCVSQAQDVRYEIGSLLRCRSHIGHSIMWGLQERSQRHLTEAGMGGQCLECGHADWAKRPRHCARRCDRPRTSPEQDLPLPLGPGSFLGGGSPDANTTSSNISLARIGPPARPFTAGRGLPLAPALSC